MTADPLGGDITDPQTLNKYAYVRNNPGNFVDPLGLILCGPALCPPPAPPQPPTGPLPILPLPPAPPPPPERPTNGGPTPLPPCLSQSDCPSSQKPLSLAQQNACTQPVLNAVNNQFGTNFTSADVQGNPFGNRGATNLIILGNGLSASQFNSIQTGRYPLNWWSYVIGYGPTLHITGQGFFDPVPATFTNSNIGGVTSVTLTAHIDTSFAYNPFGALIHLFRDYLHIGGRRNPCP